MATAALTWVVLVCALVGAALCQDGLTCNNVGETWHHQCNTCSCRDGVTVCTKDRCSSERNPITSGSCLAGSKWKDGCGNWCLCDASGKTRCTVGPCPPRVRSERSMTFVRTAGDPCAEGDIWTLECNSCSCVEGRAVCESAPCPRRAPQTPEPCEPDDRWEDECGNLCECTEGGVPACTLLACGPGQRAGARLRPILRSGDRCQNEGERWQQDCNTCDCTSGVVSCTRRLCAQRQEPEKFGECQTGTRWLDECDNLCYCSESGLPKCTLNECPYGRQEGARVHFLLEAGSTCTNEGERWQQGCGRCSCAAGRVSCSQRGCPEQGVAATAAAEPDWMSCQEDTTWEDECGNICGCWLGQPLCTRMGCPKGRVAGKPVKFIVFDGDACKNEGDSWKEECNTCSCTGGVVKCTKKFCQQQRQSVRFVSPFTALTCTPGQRWIDECDNTCFCPDSGHSACTLMSCPPGKRPMVPVRYIYADGDACTDEGSSWRHDCNMCRCLDGLVVCSSRPCRRQLLRAPLLAGSEPDSDKQCEEDKEWTDECDNNCRCSNGGLVMCTLKVCAPGKQAGRPLKVLPRLGEPCEDGSGTWHDDCNACQCVDGVTACTRGACRQRQQERDGVPVQQCRPGSSWLDECDNICSCSPNGVSYCTLKACPYGRQYGVPTKFVSAVNDTCIEEGATWRQDCNTCSCTEGRVNCTEDICQETGVSARFGPPGIRCLPGSKWTDQCENTCRCTSSGQAACSLKACPPGKKAGERVEDLPKAGEACDAEGRTWKEDCTRCTCTEGRVQCTEQICTPMDLPIRDEGPCTEDEEWIDECTNRCKCIGGEPRCTRRPCPEGGRPGVPVRFVVPDGDTCDNDGEQWKDDCNTCRCQGGRVSCTKKACVGFERGGGNKKPGECPYVPPGTLGFCFNGCNGDDMCPDDEKCCSNGCGALCMKPDTCLEGIAWEEDCNTCACINGEPACTKKLCAKEQPQSDAPVPQANERATCLEGSVWKKDCNTCDCVRGRPLCTKMLCPSKISFIDEVTGECREDSVWRKDCNRCRCIGGRAVCTLKQCGPGKPSNKGGAKELAVCELPPIEPDSDPCNGFIRRWTYDAAAGKCRRYIYGGCGGTRNLFRTRKQCRKRCAAGGAQSSRAAACRLPVKSGPCFDVMPRYYFDTAADKCRQFGFSGCGGNENNFRSLTKCIQACGGTYTSDDNQCDRRRCPWSLYKNNLDKGCEPVYENQACCPTRFDCPDVRDAGSDDACTYRGKRYAAGERVPAASRLDPCKRDCVCASNPGSGPQIDCAEVDCPAAVWNQISAGCLPLYLPDRCCPVDVQCGSRRRRSTDISLSSQGHTCQADGLTYVEGELMPTRDDPCVTCVCTTEYEGPGGPGCRFNDCLDQNSRRANSECVPVYMTDVCCPVDWKCPEDVAYRALSETSELLEISQVEPSCLLPKNRGPCSRTLERFFFSAAKRNENNFKSLADCNAACDRRKSGAASLGGNLVSLASVSGGACLLPTSAGSCSERLIRFSYDSTSGACTSFEYGGCGGNANNFVSLEQCKNTCVPTDSQDFCLLPPTSGSCDSVLLRYFFHAKSGVCESFTFGGCDGNANNFLTEEECYNKCQPGSMETKRRLQKGARASVK
ncbi:kielin/chordin-like protein [Pollicipes pollicipes]|uniref:kielin/chordin-like protein n=1 Tax=Pollicipes pollicipes TaxID=41117 RepID=UPI00188496D3|nr:kielin/chordin-like protein [Pollicipes pollicipes]